MTKKYLKLSNEEKEYIKKLAVLSNSTEADITDIFLRMLIAFSLDYYDPEVEFNFCIPFIANLKVSVEETETSEGIQPYVKIEATPNDSLIKEIAAISEGIETPIEGRVKGRIQDKFKMKLGLLEAIPEETF